MEKEILNSFVIGTQRVKQKTLFGVDCIYILILFCCFYRRYGNGQKKEYRTNTEESPRFQRLRERRVKDTVSAKPEKPASNSDAATADGELSLDLALENFPALPSPNSPNDIINNSASTNKSASTLKVSIHSHLCPN